MGLFFEELIIKVVFNDEIIIENHFKSKIANHKIAIRIRDSYDGHSGNITEHPNSTSVKVTNFGPSRGNTHNLKGDPIYFELKNDEIKLFYEKGQFKDSKELKYIKNFIDHNYYNLNNYWNAPKNISNSSELKRYQEEIEERINHNVRTYDYKKKQEKRDEAIEYKKKI